MKDPKEKPEDFLSLCKCGAKENEACQCRNDAELDEAIEKFNSEEEENYLKEGN